MQRKTFYAAALVVVLIIAVGVYYYYGNAAPAGTSANNVFVSLTDPANVPSGTTSLNVTYSDIKVHVSGGANSGWINVNGSGTLDLLSLINVTAVLGGLNLPNGSMIDRVGFNITSADINVNNTVYPVALPSNKITGNVSASAGVNGTVNIVVDLTPTIVTIFTANSTLFVLVPSVRAVMVGSATVHVGETGPIPTNARENLDRSRPNVTVSGISLSSSGNVSHISFTVTDNSNRSVILQHLLVSGNFSATVNSSAVTNLVRNITGAGASGNVSDNEQEAETVITRSQINALTRFRVLNFFLSSNGSAFLPFEQQSASAAVFSQCQILPNGPAFNSTSSHISPSQEGGSLEGATASNNRENTGVETRINDCISSIGYSLSPHSSATISFSGPISMGLGRISISFISGNVYMLALQGEDGLHTEVKVTAG